MLSCVWQIYNILSDSIIARLHTVLFIQFYLIFLFSEEILLVIKKHLEDFEKKTFKEQLKLFQRYLKHETVDIRVHALNYLRKLLEKNREELDQMVLGYNGIDYTIIELIDIFTLGCHEKDDAVKLAFGECIGELGAIEPSHLPRRYVFLFVYICIMLCKSQHTNSIIL